MYESVSVAWGCRHLLPRFFFFHRTVLVPGQDAWCQASFMMQLDDLLKAITKITEHHWKPILPSGSHGSHGCLKTPTKTIKPTRVYSMLCFLVWVLLLIGSYRLTGLIGVRLLGMLVSGEAKLCGHHDIHDIHGIASMASNSCTAQREVHPYLEPGSTTAAHPLQYWVTRWAWSMWTLSHIKPLSKRHHRWYPSKSLYGTSARGISGSFHLCPTINGRSEDWPLADSHHSEIFWACVDGCLPNVLAPNILDIF